MGMRIRGAASVAGVVFSLAGLAAGAVAQGQAPIQIVADLT